MPNIDEHIGHRLRRVMDERGLDVAAVAKLFGVKAPSVYDWLNFGRVAKKHIPNFVRELGHTAEWWISGEGDSDEPTLQLTKEQEEWLQLISGLNPAQKAVFRQCFEALGKTSENKKTLSGGRVMHITQKKDKS